jgi:hypothetical protein
LSKKGSRPYLLLANSFTTYLKLFPDNLQAENYKPDILGICIASPA